MRDVQTKNVPIKSFKDIFLTQNFASIFLLFGFAMFCFHRGPPKFREITAYMEHGASFYVEHYFFCSKIGVPPPSLTFSVCALPNRSYMCVCEGRGGSNARGCPQQPPPRPRPPHRQSPPLGRTEPRGGVPVPTCGGVRVSCFR